MLKMNMMMKIYNYVRNLSVSLSFILARNKRVQHYIRIKTHKSVILRF